MYLIFYDDFNIFRVCVCKNLVVRLASWLTLPSICCVWISFSLFIAADSVWPDRAELGLGS